MIEKPQALHVLGLELAGNEVSGAKLTQKRGKPHLDNLFTIPLPEGEDEQVKPLYIQASGKSLNEVAKHYLVAATLPASDVLVRSLDISLKKSGDIDSVLAFQAEPLLPYPIEQSVLDRIILKQTPEGSQLTILAARKDRVTTLIDYWKGRHIEPETISCVPAALAAFGALVAPTGTPLFLLHMSRSQSVCVFIRDGKLIASHVCSLHLNALEKAFNADTKIESEEERKAAFAGLQWETVDAQTYPALNDTLEQLKIELTRTFFALGKQNKGQEVADMLVTGDCGTNFDLTFYLGTVLKKHIITPEIPATFNAPLPQVLKYAIPIGVALGSLPKAKDPVNFRQGELSYPDPWKRLKQPLAIYFGLCLAVSLSLYLYGESYLGYKEDLVRMEYTNLLTAAQKPHTEFEKQLQVPEGKTLNLKNLSMEQLSERVYALEKELRTSPDIFPLLPNILSVSDVLAWLNSLPTVVSKDPKTGRTVPLIQIDNFSYAMVKRPEISKKNERYQVKVELEFTTPTPKEAREFHDALIAPNDVVDPKGEVKWSTNRGKYRASFYLKDKTVYPAN